MMGYKNVSFKICLVVIPKELAGRAPPIPLLVQLRLYNIFCEDCSFGRPSFGVTTAKIVRLVLASCGSITGIANFAIDPLPNLLPIFFLDPSLRSNIYSYTPPPPHFFVSLCINNQTTLWGIGLFFIHHPFEVQNDSYNTLHISNIVRRPPLLST